MYYTRKPLLLQ